MLAFLDRILDQSGLTPHGFCLSWDPGLLWLQAASDVLIALAYYSIPLALFTFARRRRDLAFPWVVRLFGAFILACGTTHVFGALTLWVPVYWTDGAIKAVTAALSVATAVLLWPLLPRALALPSAAELGRANAALRREIAERERAEAALRESQNRLRQAEKLTALGQLAGGIAHDFNNVLQAVGGAAVLIRRRGGDRAAVERLLGLVEDATRRGSSVTRRLLAFARRDDLRAEAVDLPELLTGLREVLAHTLGTSITVVLDAAPGLPPVLADRGQLEAVLVNLATNARDAMPRGGTLTLSAHPDAGEAAPGSPGRGNRVRLAVADTGTGMDAATLARASEPFFTTKPLGEGTGLGLAMARGFAEQSGGTLSISSEPGRGTTVALWLPAARPGQSRDALPLSPHLANAGASRILLAEPNPTCRAALAAELAEHGHEVVEAAEGNTALALLDAGGIGLLVADASLPGVNGVELVRAARRQRPDMPAILFTGHEGEGAAIAVGAAVGGPVSLLCKPVSAARLADRVAVLLAAKAGPARVPG